MAGLLEVAASIAADRETTSQIGAQLAASKSEAEELADALYAMGVDGRAEQMQQSVAALEEAEAIRAQLEAKLEEARQQILAASEGSASRTGSASSAGATASVVAAASEAPPPEAGGKGGGEDPPKDPPATPAAASDEPSDEGLEFRFGDQIDPWEAAPQRPAILEFEDEDDEFDKVMRRADDVSDGAKNIADSLDNIVKGLERGPSEGELRSITVQDHETTSTTVPQDAPTFSKASLTAGLAVLGIGTVYTGKKLVNRLRRHDG